MMTSVLPSARRFLCRCTGARQKITLPTPDFWTFTGFRHLAKNRQSVRPIGDLPLDLRVLIAVRDIGSGMPHSGVDGIFMADYEQGEIGHDLSVPRAARASKASSRSTAAAGIAAADATTGSRCYGAAAAALCPFFHRSHNSAFCAVVNRIRDVTMAHLLTS